MPGHRAVEPFPWDGNPVGTSLAGYGRCAPRISHIALTVPGMTKPPGRYDVTVRVAKDDGHSPDPAAFAAAASQAASRVNASVVSAHTARRSSALSASPRQTGPRRLRSPWPSSPARSRRRIRSGHPAGERPVPAVVRRFEEHRLPELVVAPIAGDLDVAHAAAAPGRFPGRCADARRPAHLRLARPQLMSERAALGSVLEQTRVLPVRT